MFTSVFQFQGKSSLTWLANLWNHVRRAWIQKKYKGERKKLLLEIKKRKRFSTRYQERSLIRNFLFPTLYKKVYQKNSLSVGLSNLWKTTTWANKITLREIKLLICVWSIHNLRNLGDYLSVATISGFAIEYY